MVLNGKKDFCAGMKHTPVFLFLFYFFMFTGLLNQESLFVKKCTGDDLLIDQAKQSLSLNKSTGDNLHVTPHATIPPLVQDWVCN